MSDGRKYYCLCDANCKFETMTKEQILAAIAQAAETGLVFDENAAFISKVKEINAGSFLTFWVGTQAQYNAIAERSPNCFYHITDSTKDADIAKAIQDAVASVTVDSIGAARAGFGYGGDAVLIGDGQIMDDDTLTNALAVVYNKMGSGETMMVEWTGYPAGSSRNWFGILTKSSSNNGSLVAHGAYDYGSLITKTKFSGTWMPIEWENPPMVAGVEYRTMERYKGNPVYTMHVDCGAMPNKTFKRTTFSNELVEVHSIEGIAANGNVSEKEKNAFPVVFSGNIVAYAYIQHLKGETALDVTTTQDLSSYTATFVLKYTKQTN